MKFLLGRLVGRRVWMTLDQSSTGKIKTSERIANERLPVSWCKIQRIGLESKLTNSRRAGPFAY